MRDQILKSLSLVFACQLIGMHCSLGQVAGATSAPGGGPSATLDPASSMALQQTQNLLLDPQQRSSTAEKDPHAASALQGANQVTKDPEQQKRLYEISSKIFEHMVQKSGGDGDKMQADMQSAGTDPLSFYNNLSPEDKAAIEGLANDVNRAPSSAGAAPH